MTEDELIWAMCCAYDEATDEEGIDVAMSRVLAVVREHDAARVPADAELDGLAGTLAEVRCEGLQETCWAASDAITTLRARVAEMGEDSPKSIGLAGALTVAGRIEALEARCIQMHRRTQRAEAALAAANERLAAAEENGGKSPRNVVAYYRRWQETLARVAALEAERDKLRSEAEWHPSESAPRDGEEFIAGNPGFAPFSLRWRDGQFVHLDPDDGWIALPFELWRPLPAPPSDAQEGRADG